MLVNNRSISSSLGGGQSEFTYNQTQNKLNIIQQQNEKKAINLSFRSHIRSYASSPYLTLKKSRRINR